MIEPHYPDSMPVFDYSEQLLSETQITLKNRRKRRFESMYPSSHHSFTDLARRHRFVCFFVVQPAGSGSYYSSHALLLRKRLATGFHDSMTLFVVSLYNHLPEESTFMHGTGFAALVGSTPV